MKVWEYDWEVGWYETYIEECTIELSSSYTKIEDLRYYIFKRNKGEDK